MLPLLRSLLVTLILFTATAALGCGDDDGGGGGSFADCGQVPFSPQSDDGVFKIKADGASCELATTVARGARSVDLGGTSLSYQAAGFSCDGLLAEHDGLPGVDYRCTSGDAVVTFTRN